MKKLLISIIMTTAITGSMSAESVKLPAPDLSRGTSLMQAFKDRHSEREFAPEMLTDADLSALLWAANGVNRPDGRRTAPSALNKLDVDVYVLTAEGAYLYVADRHELELLTRGDHRALIRGRQADFPIPPVALVLATTPSRFGVPDKAAAGMMGAVDVGIVSENINLFCAGSGLVTVPRASMDTEALKQLLKVGEGTELLMNNPVGYPVKK